MGSSLTSHSYHGPDVASIRTDLTSATGKLALLYCWHAGTGTCGAAFSSIVLVTVSEPVLSLAKPRGIPHLPLEICIEISRHIDLQTGRNLCLTSKQFREIGEYRVWRFLDVTSG